MFAPPQQQQFAPPPQQQFPVSPGRFKPPPGGFIMGAPDQRSPTARSPPPIMQQAPTQQMGPPMQAMGPPLHGSWRQSGAYVVEQQVQQMRPVSTQYMLEGPPMPQPQPLYAPAPPSPPASQGMIMMPMQMPITTEVPVQMPPPVQDLQLVPFYQPIEQPPQQYMPPPPPPAPPPQQLMEAPPPQLDPQPQRAHAPPRPQQAVRAAPPPPPAPVEEYRVQREAPQEYSYRPQRAAPPPQQPLYEQRQPEPEVRQEYASEVLPPPRIVGVGLLLERHYTEPNVARVKEIVHGMGAYNTGQVRLDDIVLAIDGFGISDLELKEIKHLMKGKEGSVAVLRMMRDTQPFVVECRRCQPNLNRY